VKTAPPPPHTTALTYAQGATGRPCRIRRHAYPAHSNYALLFGVSVIWTAWCECGRFQFFGGDEMSRTDAIGNHLEWMRLWRNDVVRHISPEPWLDGREFVVTELHNGARVSVENLAGDILLERVPVAWFTPAGRQWRDTSCTHARRHRNWFDGACLVFRCGEPDE